MDAPAPHITDPADPCPHLAIVVCACNSMRTFETLMTSVNGLADRLLIVDSGSTDGTIECAERHGAEIIRRPWPGYVEQKRFAIEQGAATHRWVLLLDSDESLDDTLRMSIRAAIEADHPDVGGWELNRRVWFLGGWLNHVFQPECRLRLARGDQARVVGAAGHDYIDVDGAVRKLDGFCGHDSWIDLGDMIRSYTKFADIAADNLKPGGGVLDLLFRPAFAFIKQYVIRRGILDGRRGLIACAGVAVGTFLKHLFIMARRAGLTAAPQSENEGEAKNRS